MSGPGPIPGDFQSFSFDAGSFDSWDTPSAQPAPPPAPEPVAEAPRSTGAFVSPVALAVVEADPPARDYLVRQLGNGAAAFASIEELAARLSGSAPAVVVLGPSCTDMASLSVAERLIEQHPNLGVLLVAPELTTALLQSALRAGIRDVITLTGDPTPLYGAIERVAPTLESSMARPPATSSPEMPSAPRSSRGQIITVFSTKGGAGKSVVSTNLAVALAQRSPEPVCLVDGDLQFGDVAVMLKLTPHHTLVDAVGSLDRLDAALLQSLLVTHEPTGLKVLPAPLEPAFADQVSAAEMVRIVDVLRTFCGHVVVDTPAYFNDVVLGLVEASDSIVLVAGMDIPNIKNVKIGLQTLRLLNTPMEKLHLVLNRSDSKVKLDIAEVERTLGVKADSLIPSDVIVPQSVNKGTPVILHAPRSPIAKAIYQMADQFMPAAADARRRR